VDAWSASLGAITLFVEDAARAKAFYEKVFGLSPIYEDDHSAAFAFENTTINLLELPAAHELIEPAAVASGEAGARAQLTIWVDDTDAACTELARLGVDVLNGPIDRAWGMRTATFADPDGHVWEFAQNLSEA
jgi:catechol 2,3-dioxygenase-like lactoylglutathione lyase family enzyme